MFAINSIVYHERDSSIINNSLWCYGAYVVFRFHYINVIHKQLRRAFEREGRRHVEKFQTVPPTKVKTTRIRVSPNK